jgi:ribose transport system ATP-binding protein
MTSESDFVTIRHLSKAFGGELALNDVSISLRKGSVHALLGQNGSGKSTLIKILSGYHRPEPEGHVSIAGRALEFGSPRSSYLLGCRFVHQDLALVESETVLDNLSYGGGYRRRWATIRGRSTRVSAAAELERCGVDVDPTRLVRGLPPALKTGVAVARALRADASARPHLLVLDEPTATLPVHEVDELFQIIRKTALQGICVLYVTHRLGEVFDLADEVTVLRDGSKVLTAAVGDVDRQLLIDTLVGEELKAADIGLSPPEVSGGLRPVLAIRGLSAGAATEFSLEAQAGEVIGIVGLTGSGGEDILPATFGATERASGEVVVDGRVVGALRPDQAVKAGMAYIPAERRTSGSVPTLTATENITLADLRPFWHGLRLSHRKERAEAEKWFARLSIRPAGGSARRLDTFSGGNQQKIVFAKWMRCRPRVFLLSEPTQGVDVAAKADLHEEIMDIARSGGIVLISSSDIEEITTLCHRIIVMRKGRMTRTLVAGQMTVASISRLMIDSEMVA